MAVNTDPRFSDSEERSAEDRVDQAYETSGIGLGSVVALALLMGFVLFAAVTELGHPTGPAPTKLADRSIDQPAIGTPVKPLPQVPSTQ
jgi:hypothetical protein